MSSEGGEHPLAGAANLRGGILIAVAVVIGVVLLGKGFDSGFIGSSSGDPSDEAAGSDDEGTDEGDGADATTTTTTPAHAPAEVRVQVLNSSGPTGSAGTASDRGVQRRFHRPRGRQRRRSRRHRQRRSTPRRGTRPTPPRSRRPSASP